MLGIAELLRGLDFILKSENLRALQQSLLNEGTDIQHGSGDGGLFFDKLEILLVGIAKNGGKRGERGLIIVARFEKEEFPASQVNLCEAQVEIGFQLGVGESFDFVHEELAGIHRLLGDNDKSFGFENIEKRLIDRECDLGGGGGGVLVFGFGLRFRNGKQAGGAAEVRYQLTDGCASSSAREKNRIVQAAGGEAAAGIGINTGHAEIRVGQQS